MTGTRPALVTVICIYEALAGMVALGGQIFSQFVQYAVEPGDHRLHINPLHTGVILFSALISFGIASTLWWLRREAFFLTILKVLLQLFSLASVLYVSANPRFNVPAISGSNPPAIVAFWGPRIFASAFLFVSLAISVYIYRMTFSKASNPSGTTGD